MPTYENQLQQNIDAYSKAIKLVFKSFLIMVEDLHVEHQIQFGKLKDKLPKEYLDIVDQADYLDEEKKQYLRKKILDIGNESIRRVNEELSKISVEFKF
jgi:hypothetical protein